MSNDINYEILGNNIKAARLNSGYTQQKLAEKVSCNTSHISNIENNYTKVSLQTLVAIADSLNTTVDFLLKEQYSDQSQAIENEILLEMANLDKKEKEQLLRIAKVL